MRHFPIEPAWAAVAVTVIGALVLVSVAQADDLPNGAGQTLEYRPATEMTWVETPDNRRGIVGIDGGLRLTRHRCPVLADAPRPGSCSFDDAGTPSCAPGDIEEDVHEALCPEHGGTQAGRCHPSKALRNALFLAYGLDWPPVGEWEIDHRVEESLGGAQSVLNMYPQRAPDFHQKDLVEADLHRHYCAGDISLEAARAILLGDWRTYYRGLKRKP